ncbi:MAG: zinc ribbon domain-containing protein [Planctomycetaceae bacterium]|nr:zinc ribbon domain-containing protein [Planctomycetaceae bacterium]
MTIEFNCHNCGKPLQTPEDKAGKTGKCPDCGEPVTVPGTTFASPPVNPFEIEAEPSPFASPPHNANELCPMCGASISPQAVHCPECGEQLSSPHPESSEPTQFSSGHRISVSDVISVAWARYEQQRGVTIAAVMISFLISGAGGAISSAVKETDPALGGLVNMASTLFNLWIGLGLSRLLLNVARGETAELRLLMSGGTYYGRALLSTIVLLLVMLVVFGVVALIVGLLAAVVGPVSLLVVPVLIVLALRIGLMFCWYQYLLVDVDPPGISCLSLSREIMGGNYLSVALIAVCSVLIASVGLLLFLVGFIFTAPLAALMMAVTYDHLTGGHKPFAERY